MMLFKRLWTLLTRMRVAVWLFVALLAACLLGGMIPQIPAGARVDPTQQADWLTYATDRFGARAILYRILGLFDVFHSLWFYVPLGLLALNTLVCTLNRLKTTWRAFTRPRLRISEALSARLPYQAQLPAASPQTAISTTRRALRAHGFTTHPLDDQTHLYAERGRASLLGTLFIHVGLLLLLLTIGVRSMFTWRDQSLNLPPGQAVPIPRHPALTLRNDGFEVMIYPDGTPRDYRAFVTVLEGEDEVRHATIRLNHPLKYRGVKLYLYAVAATTDDKTGPTVFLMAVRDPSYPLAVATGASILLGLTLAFQVPHNRVWVHASPDGTISIAGTTNKLEQPFSRRFKNVVRCLEQTLHEDRPA